MNRTEYVKWDKAEFPYDVAECGYCATQHASMCGWIQHAEMQKEAIELKLEELRDSRPDEFRKAVKAFRKKFYRFYNIESEDFYK